MDQRIIDMLLKDFQKESGMDLTKDLAAMQRVRDAAERARTELSTSIRFAFFFFFFFFFGERFSNVDNFIA